MAHLHSDDASSLDGDDMCWHHNTQKGCRRRRCPFTHKDLGPPCRFFYHQKGCRFGPQCNFSHKYFKCPGGCGVKHNTKSSESSMSGMDTESDTHNNDDIQEPFEKNEQIEKKNEPEKELEVCKMIRSEEDNISCGTCGEHVPYGRDHLTPKAALVQHYKTHYMDDKHVAWFYENERQQYFGQGDLDWRAICMTCYKGFTSVRGLFGHFEKILKDKNSAEHKDHDGFLTNVITPLVERDLGIIEYESELLHWLQLMISSSYKTKGKHVYEALQNSNLRKKNRIQSRVAVGRAMWELKEQELQEREWEEEEAMADRYGYTEEQFNTLLSYGIKPWEFEEAEELFSVLEKDRSAAYNSDTD